MSFLFKVHRTSRVRKYSTKTRYGIVVTSGRASGKKRAGGGREWDVIRFEHKGSSETVLILIKYAYMFLHLFLYMYAIF